MEKNKGEKIMEYYWFPIRIEPKGEKYGVIRDLQAEREIEVKRVELWDNRGVYYDEHIDYIVAYKEKLLTRIPNCSAIYEGMLLNIRVECMNKRTGIEEIIEGIIQFPSAVEEFQGILTRVLNHITAAIQRFLEKITGGK